jgi:pimeloyl-ACP methyl ester carboxylesterase
VSARVGPIAWEEQGSGEPLLLVMGLGGTRAHWHGLVPRLAATGRRVLAFDPRGVGDSERMPGPYAMAELVADALSLLDAAGVARADVLGVSLGGMVAQQLALAHPGRVRALVLGCTTAWGAALGEAPPDVIAAFDFRGKRAEAWVRELLGVNLGARWRAENAEALERLVAWSLHQAVPRASMQAQLAAVAEHDLRDRLAAIAAPALVVHGDADRIVPFAAGRALATALPCARFEPLAETGHLFWLEQPERTVALVTEFLRERA